MKNLSHLLIFVCVSTFVFAQSDPIKVTDLTKIKNVTDIITSNDGKKAIYTLKTVEELPDKPFEYEYVSNLYLLDAATPEQAYALTAGKAGASQATFSPDGSQVAFVRTINEKPQVFILPLKGGEAWQLSKCPYGASSPSFSADGSKIYFSTSISYNELRKDSLLNPGLGMPQFSIEKPGMTNSQTQIDKKTKANPDGSLAEIRAYLDKNVEDKKAKVITRLNFQGEANVEPEIKFTHIYQIDLKPNAKEKPITQGFASYSNYIYNPSKNKLFATTTDPKVHPDRVIENQIVEIDPVSKSLKTVLAQKEKLIGSVAISPNGEQVVAVINSAAYISYGQLITADIAKGNIKNIAFDRVPNGIKWHTDNKTIFFAANTNGATPMYSADIITLSSKKISDDFIGMGAFGLLEKNQILYAYNTLQTPNELAIADIEFKTPKTISALNTAWLSSKKLSLPTKGVFKNNIGQNVDYWIMKPTNLQAGKKYPLLLQLHGGPTAMWGPTETSMWHEFQYLCAQGYGIVYLNPRGSGGYGKDFQTSNYRDWGPGPASDALGAFDAAAKENWVDTSKYVITGGSYAGYLVAWIIAHDHRFKAAFAQRGVYDLKTFMGEGNAWRLVPNYFGWPWQPEAETKISANSPYTFVDKIRTPFLIKHGENDLRTGVIQSEMMFKSLKILNKDVEYVRMPGGTHELSRTGNVRQRIDRILRINEFFRRYVGE